MVSQFVSPDKVGLLGDLDFDFPEGTHAIGRLDNNSEGLLILTTNKKVTKLLFESKVPHKRVYLVQVANIVSEETLQRLRTGVSIRISGEWNMLPVNVMCILLMTRCRFIPKRLPCPIIFLLPGCYFL